MTQSFMPPETSWPPTRPSTAGTTAAARIEGWSDYTEYGTPRDPAATTAVAGAGGYGWLGAKQRSTTTQTAGLTLMGDGSTTPSPAASPVSTLNAAGTKTRTTTPTTQ